MKSVAMICGLRCLRRRISKCFLNVRASVGVITYTCFGKIYFGVLVAVLAIFYDSLYWITKAFLEKDDTNRKLE